MVARCGGQRRCRGIAGLALVFVLAAPASFAEARRGDGARGFGAVLEALRGAAGNLRGARLERAEATLKVPLRGGSHRLALCGAHPQIAFSQDAVATLDEVVLRRGRSGYELASARLRFNEAPTVTDAVPALNALLRGAGKNPGFLLGLAGVLNPTVTVREVTLEVRRDGPGGAPRLYAGGVFGYRGLPVPVPAQLVDGGAAGRGLNALFGDVMAMVSGQASCTVRAELRGAGGARVPAQLAVEGRVAGRRGKLELSGTKLSLQGLGLGAGGEVSLAGAVALALGEVGLALTVSGADLTLEGLVRETPLRLVGGLTASLSESGSCLRVTDADLSLAGLGAAPGANLRVRGACGLKRKAAGRFGLETTGLELTGFGTGERPLRVEGDGALEIDPASGALLVRGGTVKANVPGVGLLRITGGEYALTPER
ncbi:MAG: hypothetical protein IT371_04145 [Deltaproteobacteria bacterium]|nr:hypothetical protein [Deltaproteobacteria bacterium]